MHRKRGFTLLELVIMFLIIGALWALWLSATLDPRVYPHRSSCKNNLIQIRLAFQNYLYDYGSLPPAYTVDAEGNRLHSWRTLILPYLDREAIYRQIDLSKPWNDAANAEIVRSLETPFCCPSIACPQGYTNYLAVVSARSAINLKPRAIGDITDGPASTLLVIEVDARRAVHWMDPTDAGENDLLTLGPDSGLPHESGFNAAFADGSVRFLDAELSPSIRWALITIDGGESIESHEF